MLERGDESSIDLVLAIPRGAVSDCACSADTLRSSLITDQRYLDNYLSKTLDKERSPAAKSRRNYDRWNDMQYYKVKNASTLKQFLPDIEAGSAHIDKGFDFLGKDMYQQGLSRVLVGLNAKSGIFGPDADGVPAFEAELYLGLAGMKPSDVTLADTDLTENFNEYLHDCKMPNHHTWMPLEHLMWVLEPTALYEKVFAPARKGGTNTAANPRARSLPPLSEVRARPSFKRQQEVALYYNAQVGR